MGDGERSGWPLSRHVLLLVLAVLALWPLLELDTEFISDEGSYALQARVLRETDDWDMGYPFAAADPEVTYPAHHAARVVGGEVFPYVDHPLWPRVLAWTTDLVGEGIGLRVVGVGSLVAVAAVGWLLGRHLEPRAAPLAFWVLATSSVLANAWMLWAHAASALAGALLMLAAVRPARGWPWLVVAAGASAVGVLLRAEGMLWALAVAAAVLLTRRDRRGVLLAAVTAGSAGVARALEDDWIRRIIDASGGSSPLDQRGGDAGFVDRLGGLRRVLIDGAFVSEAGKLLGLAAVVLAVVAAVALVRRSGRAAAAALGAAGAVLLVRLVVASEDPAPGLLVVAPALALAVAWRPRDVTRDVVVVATVLFLGAVAVTIYPDGGSFQWGGRYLSPAIGALAVLAAAAVRRAQDGLSSAMVRPLTVGVVLLLLGQAVSSVVGPDQIRRDGQQAFSRLLAAGPPVFIAHGTQAARVDWRGWPERCWIAVPDDGSPEDLREVLAVVARSGIDDAVYVGFAPDEIEAAGAAVVRAIDGLQAGVVALPSPAGSSAISAGYGCDR